MTNILRSELEAFKALQISSTSFKAKLFWRMLKMSILNPPPFFYHSRGSETCTNEAMSAIITQKVMPKCYMQCCKYISSIHLLFASS